jgi:6-phosphogluconolactonase (cycloisomerase 2 family)
MNRIVSRRNFLRSSAIATAGAALMPRTSFSASPSQLAYVGTYTGSDGHGEGIYLFDFDSAIGALKNRKLAAATTNPSWIALHPNKRFLYAVNEGDKSGSVTAFAVDSSSGSLRQLNAVSSHGSAPCHLSFDPSGKFAFVANYVSGTIAVLPIHADGSLGEATDVQTHKGVSGATNGATNAPKGSFTTIGHDAPHAHFIHPDISGKFILAVDLGQDRIYTYRFDSSAGKLTQQATTSVPTGDGPRHLAFHPNGKWIYAITEQASTLIFFEYDPESGSLTSHQTVSALPENFAGTSYGSEITMHPNGKWIYVTNRLHDSIGAYAIGADGHLTHIGHVPTLGDYPRHTNIDPSGRYFFVCNQKGDNVTSFRIHPQTGALTSTGNYTAVGTPACIIFA